ncbi:MAG: class I SAM-dependent rRNA methyltransferase [Bdellovibrionales bacterium]
MKIWRLGRGGDRRFRRGHPWIFASELGHSAKEIVPGEVVELHDYQDRFLAYGYGHPSSQICFRKLTSRAKEKDVLSERFFTERLRAARDLRVHAGLGEFSHRWMFAEADGVPGLIIDAFKIVDRGWLAVVQASTAGIDRALPSVYEALKSFAKELGDLTIVEAPSSKSRALEGLKVGEKKIVFGAAKDIENCAIVLRGGLVLHCDLLRGQKTGFFLDQQSNAGMLRELLVNQFKGHTEPVRVLDICCYVGQWAGHSAHALKSIGVRSEVTLLDVSSAALSIAEKNLKPLSEAVHILEASALDALAGVNEGSFDVVICDPPAFVKKKADLPQGLKAYAKLNRMAMRTVKAGGLYVASSCSGLVKGDDWNEVLVESSVSAGRMFKQLALGGHAADHPIRPEFPEGEYLKCVIGRIDYPY